MGVIIPALIAAPGLGYDPTLAPYPFRPDHGRALLREAGYPAGLPITLIASEDLAVQATVVSKMLEQGGFQVALQILDAAAYNRHTLVSYLEQPAEHQAWDIALTTNGDNQNFPAFNRYHRFALDGPYDWVVEQPVLRQQDVLRQMEQHTWEQAYFLFLYNPIALYAVNEAVEFVPYLNGVLNLTETGVTGAHWSVHQQKTIGHE
jgi:ABC-type transport system substrate-binding protein